MILPFGMVNIQKIQATIVSNCFTPI